MRTLDGLLYAPQVSPYSTSNQHGQNALNLKEWFDEVREKEHIGKTLPEPVKLQEPSPPPLEWPWRQEEGPTMVAHDHSKSSFEKVCLMRKLSARSSSGFHEARPTTLEKSLIAQDKTLTEKIRESAAEMTQWMWEDNNAPLELETKLERMEWELGTLKQELKRTQKALIREMDKTREASETAKHLSAELERVEFHGVPQFADEEIRQRFRVLRKEILAWSLPFAQLDLLPRRSPLSDKVLQISGVFLPGCAELHEFEDFLKSNAQRRLFVRAWVGRLVTICLNGSADGINATWYRSEATTAAVDLDDYFIRTEMCLSEWKLNLVLVHDLHLTWFFQLAMNLRAGDEGAMNGEPQPGCFLKSAIG
jgi:hypothetical protein